MDPQNIQGQGAQPAGQNPQGQGQTQPPQAMPPQGFPPQGMYPPQGFPQGGMDPAMYGNMGMMGGAMPPQEPEDNTPANFQLGTKFAQPLKIKLPAHDMSFDETYFLTLLAGSISLSRDEKKRIIESVPKLKQSQIDELISIFEEEKEKFAALSKKHVPQLEKLAQQHYNEWMDLETEVEQAKKKNEDQDKAEAIRKQLGL